jgi:2-keto-4-pentenoate hydratase
MLIIASECQVRNRPPLERSGAYAVQEQITERRISEGARLVGRKIGLTAPSVQAQLGVSQPDYGMLFHDMDVPIGGEIPLDRVVQPKVEAEIAFIMGRDLTSEKLTTADVLGAIEWAVPALEIVDSRIRARSLQELAKRDGIARRYIRRLVGLACARWASFSPR